MTVKRIAKVGKWVLLAVLLAVVATAGAAYYLTTSQSSSAARAAERHENSASDDVRVEVTRPLKGVMPRTTTQPGSVQSFEAADLYAGASGYLGRVDSRGQAGAPPAAASSTGGEDIGEVDIGDHVQKGQVLAQVEVPDLVKQVEQHQAELEAAQASVAQAQASVVSALADVEAAKAEVTRASEAIKSTHATAVFRQKQYDRMVDLFHTPSGPVIDERLVDEHEDERDAAVAAENEAVATKAKADTMVAAANAKVAKARADVIDAQAGVKVAQATLEKAQVLVDFATIKSPYTGVITYRAYFPGDYVRAASEGGDHTPLLRVERTDKMRLVVEVPDRDVPYCNVGDTADVELDALPGVALEGVGGKAPMVSRMADSEDATTRLMRVEIDLANPTGKISQGMYGHVTIHLDQAADLLSIPSSCLAGKGEKGKASVFVVRDGKAVQVPVTTGTDNGVRVAILKGLTGQDKVVQRPPSDLVDGTPVVASDAPPDEAKPTN